MSVSLAVARRKSPAAATVSGPVRIASALRAVLVCALAVAGLASAAQMVNTGRTVGRGSPPTRLPTVRAAWGQLSVTDVTVTDGLDHSSLGGMAHGIGNLVRDDQRMISLRVVVTRTSGSTGRFDPNSMVVRLPRGKRVSAAAGSLQPVRLPDGGSLAGTVMFVVPRTASVASLGVRGDSGQAADLPLTGASVLTPATTDDHSNGSHTS